MKLIFLLSFSLFAKEEFFNKCMDKFPTAGKYLKTHQLTTLCKFCGNEKNWNEPYMCIARRIRERSEIDAEAAQKCVNKIKAKPNCDGLSAY